MARFYTNENFPVPAAQILRELGHDVLTIQETVNANRRIEDLEVLRFATEHQRAIVTFNRRHFIRLHSEHPTHSGIVVCTVDPDLNALAQRIHNATTDDLNGRLVRINRPG
jgi:hypothetical protein